MYRVNVDDSGRVSLPQRVVAALSDSNLAIGSSSPQHVLLAVEGAGEACLTATLGDMGVADILSFFNMFRKTGILYLDLSDGNRKIYFQDGEIIFATSQRFEEDLGEILCELGKLDRETLTKVRVDMEDGAVLNQVLVRKKIVVARDLWLATRHQVEAIVYNLFSCQGGGCYFVAQELQRDDIVRLSMSTQNLIMEGLRRVDERALYMRRLRSLDAMLSYSGKSPADLDAEEKKVVSMVYSVSATVGQLVARSGLSDFNGLRVVYQLVEKRMVDIAQPQEVALDPEFVELFDVYNGVLALLYDCIGEKESNFIEEINRFLREVSYPMLYVLRSVSLEKDGTLDGRVIVKNLMGLELLEQKKLLVETLNELVYMECTIARRTLGAQGSAELIRRVQEITARTKRLVVKEVSG
ncbi:MAG: DUF4388 domain-containing protein [Thermodesulfobacteriota bacterium]|nr:DUF4388 domain-containing protein [Thermodesulfobacteriota bacterium]